MPDSLAPFPVNPFDDLQQRPVSLFGNPDTAYSPEALGFFLAQPDAEQGNQVNQHWGSL